MDKALSDAAAKSGRNHTLNAEDFLALGLSQVAYIKAIKVKGREAWAVHAADGSPLTLLPAEEMDVIMAMIRQNDLEPLVVIRAAPLEAQRPVCQGRDQQILVAKRVPEQLLELAVGIVEEVFHVFTLRGDGIGRERT